MASLRASAGLRAPSSGLRPTRGGPCPALRLAVRSRVASIDTSSAPPADERVFKRTEVG